MFKCKLDVTIGVTTNPIVGVTVDARELIPALWTVCIYTHTAIALLHALSFLGAHCPNFTFKLSQEPYHRC